MRLELSALRIGMALVLALAAPAPADAQTAGATPAQTPSGQPPAAKGGDAGDLSSQATDPRRP